MYCPYCKDDKLIKSENKKFHLATLECNHTLTVKEQEIGLALIPKVESNLSIIEVSTDRSLSNQISLGNDGLGNEEIVKKEPLFTSRDGKSPYPFQEDGIKFVKDSGFRCLIADEMGLGKTIQGLGALKLYPEITTPALIIVKSSLKRQIFSEVVRWCGIKGYLTQIVDKSSDIPVEGFDVYIASYDILRRFTKKTRKTITNKYGMEVDKEIKTNPFYELDVKTVILDEAQSIKNLRSTRTEEVFRICEGKANIIALSGTPFKNNIMEYYPILHLLKPDRFPTEDYFDRNFVKYGWIGSSYKPTGLKDPDFFKRMTEDFIIRRERKEVMPQLPEINRVFHHVDFETEKLKKDYLDAQEALIEKYEEKAKNKSPQELLGIMAVVRHIVGISKIRATVEKISEFLQETDRKLVVFTHHEDVQDLIHLLTTEFCLNEGYEVPLKFHSSLTADERNDTIKKFRDSDARVMVASTLAAGEGLNLQFCSDCIIVERQWNPANEEQAEGRFIRIGQERNQVNAIYMIISNTMDEWFTEIVEEKRRIFKSAMLGQDVQEVGSLLEELMNVIISKGRKRTVRGF